VWTDTRPAVGDFDPPAKRGWAKIDFAASIQQAQSLAYFGSNRFPARPSVVESGLDLIAANSLAKSSNISKSTRSLRLFDAFLLAMMSSRLATGKISSKMRRLFANS